ncbi:MAG: TMEM165/GDT1 family protein [Candidatus Thorarchaeota archaeon]|nr:MAG: hypothetical protein DRO73_05830 [Candidatus Thorarchaeota archaeon]
MTTGGPCAMFIQTLLSTAALVLLTELGDKTMVTALCLSAQSRRPRLVLLVSLLALLVASFIAVVIGSVLSTTLPLFILVALSAGMFILLGIATLLRSEDDVVCAATQPQGAMEMFSLVLFSELGDKSEIAIIALASTSGFPLAVLVGAMIGFLVVNSVGVLAGDRAAAQLPARFIKYVTGAVFIIFGVLTLLGMV